jgi:glycosyltransferase involved in cell wall biosynthesis
MSGSPETSTIVVDALAARFGGTAYAGVQISQALARRRDVDRVVVIVRPESIVDRGLRASPKVSRVVLTPTGGSELAQRLAWEALRLPALLRRVDASGMLTLSGMLPLQPPCPFVGLQANPTPYEDPASVSALVRRFATARSAQGARATYVPSKHVARLVGDIPRVRVVPLGVDRARFRPGNPSGHELLCVADFYAHKHHELLLGAYARLPAPRPVLRLIGNPDVDEAVYARVCAAAAHLDGVIVAGRVSFDELAAAYARARAFLIASNRESFCMPLAEALAAGVPAIASDYPTLRETAGPGAVYVAGNDPDSWARAIAEIVQDDARHARLRDAGIRHAQRFSWDAFAAALVEDLLAERYERET